MSIRNVYGVTVLPQNGISDTPLSNVMTIVSDLNGNVIHCRSQAQKVAKTLVGRNRDFMLEQRFVVYQPDGSLFYFPDPDQQFADPHHYPIDIAYGFILARPEEKARDDLMKLAIAAKTRLRRSRSD
jgi:hypothetical protein